MTFKELHEVAIKTLNPRQISQKSFAGSVAAALLTADGNVYTGVCIDTPSGMGFCAEHAAIASMITAGETKIVKLVSVHYRKDIVPPCGRCREFISQINDENIDCEVLISEDKVVTIKDLLPYRWV
ncbi:cytidine deaminase [Clostridium sp. 'deep sea']|uniref:cytidine deaminase family protein n=1 Tax=Clostridium sp. 'deep sea' TaxID=2779445 RepID=UPI0018963F8D|nr:cytidine deaminase [Clostridium sp. 'deep sea']QOR35049.1 cytidine deaminase [Clostridium sp. 'deep sea']